MSTSVLFIIIEGNILFFMHIKSNSSTLDGYYSVKTGQQLKKNPSKYTKFYFAGEHSAGRGGDLYEHRALCVHVNARAAMPPRGD